MPTKRIIVLGGGFAGVKCARRLRQLLSKSDYEIVLFNHENHTVFHPLLAEVVSAALQPKDVAAPIRQLLHDVQCRTEDVLNLDLPGNQIEYEAHNGQRREMTYDQLVIACGKGANLGLVPGMDEHAHGLKTIGDALALQAHIMEQLEKAEVCDELQHKKSYLSFIIVGGGFSGVEVAGEINDLVRRSRRFFNNIKDEDISVTIVHSREQILPEVPPSLREFARAKMEKAGVRMVLNNAATHATAEGIELKDGRFLAGRTIVCTIGTVTLPMIKRLNLSKNNDRIATEGDLSLPGYPNVWAMGDCAAVVNALDGSVCPPVAQFAERQGVQVANNIAARLSNRPTHAFSYKMMGSLCAIGGHNAVAEIFNLHLSGFAAWFLWRGIYLMKLPSISQRTKVGLEWMCDLIFPRCLAHLKADRSNRVARSFYAAGDYVFHEGDAATDFFIIQSGQVEILRNSENDKENIVAVLGAGDFFGEAALVDSRPRNATVRARTDLEVVILGRSVFSHMSQALTPLRDAVASAVKRRTTTWQNLAHYRARLDAIELGTFVEDISAAPLYVNDSIEYAIERVNREKLDFSCVLDESDKLCGILTRTDLIHAIEISAHLSGPDRTEARVKDIMMPDPLALTADVSTTVAVLTMREHGMKRMPIVDGNETRKVVGYIRIENLMETIHRVIKEEDLKLSVLGDGNLSLEAKRDLKDDDLPTTASI